MSEPKYMLVEVLRDTWWVILPAFAVALIATPIARAVAYRTKIVDRPDDLLKPHGRPVAYLGGLGIWSGMMVGLADNPLWNLLGVMVSSTVIMIVGLLDDLLDIRPSRKVLGQVPAATILMAGGVGRYAFWRYAGGGLDVRSSWSRWWYRSGGRAA